ncbi:MAG: glycosyltransferase [candidate division NC10 bacterium]
MRQLKRLEEAAMARYMGGVGDTDLCHLYNGCRALVFPSHYEGFGYPLVEAMACQVPVIGSDSGEIPNVIGDAGLVFHEDDAAGLRAHLQRLADDPGERANVCEQHPEIVERLTALLEAYRREGRSTPRPG